MQESQFQNWLINNKYHERTISSRLSNCRRIEDYEGDLDEHFKKDQGISLVERLQYSSSDQNNARASKHRIPINGNIYNGTATFRSAVNLYFNFKKDNNTFSKVRRETIIPMEKQIYRNARNAIISSENIDTPENKISKFEFDICLILAQLCYHIHPKIIHAIQGKNSKQYDYFKELFGSYINVDDYLFEGSACVFPGVRRYISSQGTKKKYNPEYKAIIDDNTFPRHLWCFLVNNKTYNGPNWKESGLNQFELAHIFTHKKSELNFEKQFFRNLDDQTQPLGDFTCACNIVLLPKGTVRPTDNSENIKAIFYQRYIELYGENTLQGRKNFITNKVPAWYSKIKWNEPFCPLKWEEKVDSLLRYRTQRIKQLIDNIEK